MLTALPLDVTDTDAIAAAIGRIDELTAGHGVDVLVNAAGYALIGPVEGLSNGAIEHQFATNVFGLLNVTRALIPRMRERHGGRIINISSILGRFALPGLGAYAASRYALEAISDALRIEVAPDQFRAIDTYVAEPIAHNSITPEAVARKIATAAEARRPKTRHVVPARSKLMIGLLGTLPDRIADNAKRSTVGIER